MGKKVSMSAVERIFAMEMLPKQGNMLTLRTATDVVKILNLDDLERKKIGLAVDPLTKQTTWQPIAYEVMKDIDFTDAGFGILKAELISREGSSELTMNEFSLYEKIVEGGKE